MFEKLAMKNEITDDEIIKLYKAGISQKDIVLNCPVDVIRTQRVLKSAGFATHLYRSLKEEIKQCVIRLITSGCTYYGIEEKCDISFHSVREIVEKNDLKGISKKNRIKKGENIKYIILPEYEDFLRDYRMGDSYVSLCRRYKFNSQQLVYIYNLISEADIKLHRENMMKKMFSLKAKGLSAASIAAQLDISPAIVRKTIG